MSKKELIVIAVLIVVFGGLYFLRSRDKVSYTLPKTPEINKEKIDEIQISFGKNNFDIVKNNNRWVLKQDGTPVKEGFVDNILDKCANLKFVALVSTTGNYDIYDLDEKAVNLKLLQDGKTILELRVGKNSPTYMQTYVVIGKDPNVYQVGGNLKGAVKKLKQDIIDRRVLNFEAEKVNKIVFKNGDKEFGFEKKGKNWVDLNGKDVKGDKVKEVVESLSTLSAASVLPELKGKVKNKVESEIIITTDKDIVLKCYGLKDKDYLCESSQYPMPFTITKTLYKTIFKEKKYFEKKLNKKGKPQKEKKSVNKKHKMLKNGNKAK